MSVAVEVRFPAGRYHASPWDRHVNEADVEWPPSPLRLLRTLIAVWHRKANRDRYSEEVLRSLIHRLADEPPVYRLPTATLAHTRHYMPIRSGRSEKTTLVFDAFLRLDPDEELLVLWPETELDSAERELLGHLLERTGYLGRAESWADLRLVDAWSRLPNSGPRGSGERWGADGNLEMVDLPVAMPPAAYGEWRDQRITELGLEKPRLVREKKLAATMPADLLDALRLDTGETRDVGWSQAPGTTTVTYLRPRDWHRPDREAAPGHTATERSITTARLALIGKPLPRLEDAIKVGEVTRAAAISVADGLSEFEGVPPTLSGHDMPEDATHQHAFYLPDDADGDGRIDHVLVHAERGFGPDALSALDRIARLWISDGGEWQVMLESYGSVADFDHSYLGPARVWHSVTPYLHPWYRKKTFTVEDQIQRELTGRNLPAPELERIRTVSIHGRPRRPVHFHRFRRRSGLAQPDTKGSFWRLTFPEPVVGPIALGFGCHFGLGIFEAAR